MGGVVVRIPLKCSMTNHRAAARRSAIAVARLLERKNAEQNE